MGKGTDNEMGDSKRKSGKPAYNTRWGKSGYDDGKTLEPQNSNSN
jgi:hypothetical protein